MPTHFPRADALPSPASGGSDRKRGHAQSSPPPLPARLRRRPGFRPGFIAPRLHRPAPSSPPRSPASPPALPLCPRSPASAPLSCFGPTLRRPAPSPACGALAPQPPCPRSLPSLRACPASRSASPRIPASHSEPGFGRPPRPHSLRIPPPSAATPRPLPEARRTPLPHFSPAPRFPAFRDIIFFRRFCAFLPECRPAPSPVKAPVFPGNFRPFPVFSVDMPSVFPRHTPSFFHKTGKSLRRKAKKTLPM